MPNNGWVPILLFVLDQNFEVYPFSINLDLLNDNEMYSDEMFNKKKINLLVELHSTSSYIISNQYGVIMYT